MDSKDSFPWSFNFGSGNVHQFGGDKVTMPPPVSMSLRARESSALALKRIFDQINGSTSARDESTASPQPKESPVGGYQVGRNQSLPDLRSKFLSEADFSFSRRDPEPVSPGQAPQPGFGSPISMSKDTATQSHNSSEKSGGSNWSNTNISINAPHNETSIVSRPNPASRPQSTAQLTIFYSGSVNVYNNVPADKAHAIMILAGNSSPANTNDNTSVEQEKCNPPTPHNTTMANITKSISENVVTTSSPSVAPSPSPSTPLIPPPSPSSIVATEPKQQVNANCATKRLAQSGMELPHARKASLARFLEKRKDRQVQQHNVNENPKPPAECSWMDPAAVSSTGLPNNAMSNKKPCLDKSSLSHFTNKTTVDQGGFSLK